MTSQDSVASGIATDYLAKMSRTRVFFGHRSVGMNMLDSRAIDTYQGQVYYWLCQGYPSDSGHLNDEDARIAVTARPPAIAQASPR